MKVKQHQANKSFKQKIYDWISLIYKIKRSYYVVKHIPSMMYANTMNTMNPPASLCVYKQKLFLNWHVNNA